MKKLRLKHPLTLGNKVLDELSFREFATAEDLLAFDERGANRQTIALIANLSGQDESVIKKLHVNDFRAADAIASDLIKPEADEKNALES